MLSDPAAFHIDSFLRRHIVLLSFTSKGLFCRRGGFSQFKTLRERPYSFYQLTQFSDLNNVTDPLAFNLYSSLTRGTVLLAFTWMGLYCRKVRFLTLENTGRYAVFLQHANSILTAEQHWQTLLLLTLTTVLLTFNSRHDVLLTFNSMGLFCTKGMILPHENTER
jgi:hypothetical protein